MSFALITGASKGIGRAIAFELAERGYHLVLVARSNELLETVKTELVSRYQIQVFVYVADLTESTVPKQLFEWCAQQQFPVSILVNNAGYGLSGPFESYPVSEHLNMIQLNCTSLVQMTYLFLPLLKQQPKAYVLNISSSSAYQAVPYLSLYAASKAFVLQFSRGLRYELRKSNVGITCISPGTTDTAFNTRANIGEKAMRAARKVQMTPAQVGKVAVESMLKGRAEVVVGLVNKLGGFFAWLLPKKLVERTAANLYE